MIRPFLFLVVAGLSVAVVDYCNAESIGRLLMQDGWDLFERGETSHSLELFEDAFREACATNQRVDIGECNAKLAWIHMRLNDSKSAARKASLAVSVDLQDDDRARVEIVLARTATSKPIARRHLEAASTLLEKLGNRRMLATTHLELARLLLQSGKYEEALASAEKASSLFDVGSDAPLLAKSWLLVARTGFAAHQSSKGNRAISTIRELQKRNDNLGFSAFEQSDLQFVLAESHIASGNYSAALISLQRARNELLSVLPDNHEMLVPIVLQQAVVLIELGRLNEALEFAEWSMHFERILSDRLAALAFATRGQVHLEAGRLKEANRDLETAVFRSRVAQGVPSADPIIQLLLWKTRLSLGKQIADENDVREFVGSSENTYSLCIALRILAQEKRLKGRSATALSLVSRSLDLTEKTHGNCTRNRLEGLILLCNCQLDLSRLDQVENTIERATKIIETMRLSDLWDARLEELSGRLFLALGKFDTSESHFRKSLQIWQKSGRRGKIVRDAFASPEKASVHLGLLAIHIESGNTKKIGEEWDAAYAVMAAELNDQSIARRVSTMADFCAFHNRVLAAVWHYQKAQELLRTTVGTRHPQSLELQRKLDQLVKNKTRIGSQIDD